MGETAMRLRKEISRIWNESNRFMAYGGYCLQDCLVSVRRHHFCFCLRLGVAQILCALPLSSCTGVATSSLSPQLDHLVAE
jgi:hypothetical protein